LGIGLGPIIGSIIYHFGNVFFIYVFPSFILFGFGYFLVKTILPEEENGDASAQNSENLSLIVIIILNFI
jgi:hypothetical protein